MCWIRNFSGFSGKENASAHVPAICKGHDSTRHESHWMYELVPQLMDQVQLAYATLPTPQSGKFSEVKAVILRQYEIEKETY